MCHTIDSNAYKSLESKYQQQEAATMIAGVCVSVYNIESVYKHVCISQREP